MRARKITSLMSSQSFLYRNLILSTKRSIKHKQGSLTFIDIRKGIFSPPRLETRLKMLKNGTILVSFIESKSTLLYFCFRRRKAKEIINRKVLENDKTGTNLYAFLPE